MVDQFFQLFVAKRTVHYYRVPVLLVHVPARLDGLVFVAQLDRAFERDLAGIDLVVGANGAFSWLRSENEAAFGTT